MRSSCRSSAKSARFQPVSWELSNKTGVVGLTFNDLRGTAVTRLGLVGCTEAQIVSITGHSLNDARSILDFVKS
jgi:hypothetical protein